MKPVSLGYQVGIVGASSLLGQELLRVLNESAFPVSRLVSFETIENEDGPDLPIVDLGEHLEIEPAGEGVSAAELDFIFLAERPRPASGVSPAIRSALEAARLSAPGQGPRCVVIDMVEALGEPPANTSGGIPVIPFLERAVPSAQSVRQASLFISMHPAAIVLSALLLRLGARFPLKSAVAQVFVPVSEKGPRAIEELQKQTVNLLSFQKIPEKVFGAQLAFNLLAHLGGKHDSDLADVECRIRKQTRQYLGERVPLPALRLIQVPVFYSLAFSLYFETAQPTAPEAVGAALAGERIRVRRRAEPPPSQVEAAGSGIILVDTVTPDPEHPMGVWIWAAVDNIRLAAENAVEIADSLRQRVQ